VGALFLDPIRLVHTGDVHLDMSFAGQSLEPAVARRKRQAIRRALELVVESAREADALLIAGDLFEHHVVRPDTVRFCIALFGSIAPTPVYITPGNHDLYNTSSPYAREQWPENVFIFSDAQPSLVDHPSGKLRVMGFAHTTADMTRHVLAEIEAPPDGPPTVLVAHAAAVDGLPDNKEPYAPFVKEDIAGKRFAYVALGHYHTQRAVLEADPPAWYCGEPESLGCRETDAHGYLEVVLTSSGVEIHPKKACQLPYVRFTVNCEGAASSSDVIEQIKAHAAEAIAEVTLVGAVSPDVEISADDLSLFAGESFVNLVVRDHTTVARDYEALAREPTAAGEFVAEMLSRIASAGEEEKGMLREALSYGLNALEGRELRTP